MTPVETHDSNLDSPPDRYHRQMLLEPIGGKGQRRLGDSRVLVIGCGALGSVAAEQLARAGVGFIRIVDRDVVEWTNLQRQVLFDESDAREGLPKSIAAANRLARINSTITLEPIVADVDAENVEKLASDVDLILDGTDNVQTRYLINDAAVKHDRPWIYGACVGTEGRMLAIRPNTTACLRCVFPNPPGAGELPTCDTGGVLGPVAAVIGALQAVAAIKLLAGREDALGQEMLTLDLWTNRIKSIATGDARRADCPACALRRFEFLAAPSREMTLRLCGRNAVQIRRAASGNGLSLDRLAERLQAHGTVRRNEHLVRATVDGGIDLTAFADGRVIVHGTHDLARARSIYARFIGA